MSTITTLNSGDSGSTSRTVINTNFTNLNTDKLETAVESLAKQGETGLTGDVTLSAGDNILLTQAGNNIVIGVTGIGSAGDMESTTYDPAGIAQQVVGTSATQTLTNKTLTNPTINTPTIATPTISNPTVTGTVSGSPTISTPTLTSPVLNTGLSGTAFLDEDDMASDSATKTASQQSIKAYVDGRSPTKALNVNDTILNVANTVTQTDLVSYSLTGGSLGASNGFVRIKIDINPFTIFNGDHVTIRLKYGSTTVASMAFDELDGGYTGDVYGHIEAVLAADGSASAQQGKISIAVQNGEFGTTSAVGGALNAIGTATENSANTLTVAVSVQWNDAHPDNQIGKVFHTIELVK